MTTLGIAVVFLLCMNLGLVGVVLWVLSKVRSDQLIIRTFIARQVRDRRAAMGAPTDDDAFFEWLQRNPDRPHKDDPPLGRSL